MVGCPFGGGAVGGGVVRIMEKKEGRGEEGQGQGAMGRWVGCVIGGDRWGQGSLVKGMRRRAYMAPCSLMMRRIAAPQSLG